jgi:hypothetical protein
MKKFTYVLVIALALTTMLSTAALAGNKPGCGACPTKSTCADAPKASSASVTVPKAPGKCCVKSAAASKACCGKDAKTVAASVSAYNASQAALKDMHPCCAEAVVAGKGCCGKDAEGVKAAYAKQVGACSTVLGSMDKCCADALAGGKGCCGKTAAELKAACGAACDAHKGATGASTTMPACTGHKG